MNIEQGRNCTIKLPTKLVLANRLQAVIMELVCINQYMAGFIKSRAIQDCIAWAYGYLFQCHKASCLLLYLKIDFEKAFDELEHGMILAILSEKGFGTNWCSWIEQSLSIATWCWNYVSGNYIQIAWNC
ncbi:hypothetical protein VPH35_061258 [Triticum aestivum]